MVTLYFKKSEDDILNDLKSLVDRSVELGADRALIITPDKVVVDDRVRAKCRYPPCPGYATSLMCPPHSMDPEETRKLTKLYKQAILVRVYVDPKDAAGPKARKRKAYHPYATKLHNIINQLESEAFYKGYYLALGFENGGCRLCSPSSEKIKCEGLNTGMCTHPMDARPSMESVGIDVYATVNGVGWDIYPIGRESDPTQTPCAGFYGLLFVL